MPKSYWIMKTEPSVYSYDDLARKGMTFWDGVRNFQARKNLKGMKKGDEAFIYHSVGPKEIVGVARIVKESYPDPTDPSGVWVAVDVEAGKPLKNPVSLDIIKVDKILSNTALVKQSRLSVMPVSRVEADRIFMLGGMEKN